jgi:TolB protein
VKNGVIIATMILFCVFRPCGSCSAESGGRIAFVTTRDGTPEIYTMDSDGASQRRLADNDARDWVPAWAPDREKIAFWSNRDGS